MPCPRLSPLGVVLRRGLGHMGTAVAAPSWTRPSCRHAFSCQLPEVPAAFLMKAVRLAEGTPDEASEPDEGDEYGAADLEEVGTSATLAIRRRVICLELCGTVCGRLLYDTKCKCCHE